MSETSLHCDGRIAITVEPREMRMSHWLYAPLVVDQQRQQVLLDLSDSLWDLIGTADETASGIDLLLRKYPGDQPSVTLSIDIDRGVLKLADCPVDATQLLAALDTALC
ncbi:MULTISPECIES: hypothetical protein [unclassified Pseudomonas]|uniref:hypothetical protein n=1 Tax=unclassified Pseudomonas TaxID=196821 RepID=UPI0030DBEAD1